MKFPNGVLALGVLILGPLAADAQTTIWSAPNGTWSSAGNWTNGTPTTSGTAEFSSTATSSVDTNFTIADLSFLAGSNVALTSSGGALTVTGATTDSSAGTNSIGTNLLGGGTMSVSGGGTLTLSGNNTYSGATTITSGTLQAGSATAFGPMSQVTIGASGVLDLNNFNNAIYALSGSGSVTLGTGAGGTLTVGGGLGPFINTTYSGVISGNGGLDYNTYDQTLTLTGANTYTGTTTIGQGNIEIGNGGTAGSISPSSNIVFGSNAQITFARSDANSYANVISGTGTVEALNGTVTLTGANSYRGVTDVVNATLDAGSTTAFGIQTSIQLTSGTVNLNGFNVAAGSIAGDAASSIHLGTNTLTLQNLAANTLFAGAITGTGSIDIVVTSNLDLTGNANTYSGGTTINSGNVYADNTNPTSSATGLGTVTINVGGSLTIGNDSPTGYIANLPVVDNGILGFQRTDAITFPNQITGTGGVEVQDGGTVTLTGNNTYSGLTAIDQATLKAGSSTALGSGTTALSFNYYGGTLDLNGFNITIGSLTGGSTSYASDLILGSNTLTIGGVPGTTSFSGIISGTGGITLTGPATEQTYLTNADTYTGPTVIGAGAVLGLGFTSTSGSISGTSGVSGAGTLLFYEPTPTTFAPPISGALSVSQVGAGAVTLAGANTYSGATTINAGSLVAGSTSAFGSMSAVTINGTGELNLNGFNNTIYSLAGTATSSVVLGGATLTIADPAGPTYYGAISGGGLSFTGNGTVILDGANTLPGGVAISGITTLQIGDGATPGESLSGNVANSGTLVFEPASSDNLTYAGVISGTGSVTFYGTGTVTLSGANTYTGLTYVNSGALADGAANSFSPTSGMLVNSGATLNVNHNETVANLQNGGMGGTVNLAPGATLESLGLPQVSDFEGVIAGAGAFAVGPGGVVGLAGNNNFSGGTTILGNGEIFVGSNTALGTGTLTFNGSGTELSPDVPSVTLANTIVLDSQLDNDDGGSSNLTLTGPISGPSEIVWCTPGTLTLTNPSNSFAGGIDMREGILVVTSNGAASSGAITLDTGTTLAVGSGVTVGNFLNFTGASAVLTGAGTIATPVTVNSAAVIAPAQYPGGGPSNLTFSGGLTLASGGAIQFDLYDANGAPGAGYSLITVAGGLSLTASPGTLTFDLNSVTSSGSAANAINFNPSNSYTWMFATSSSPITGFSASDFNLVTSGFSNGTVGGTFSFSESGDSLYLNFTPVPEPSTWALLGTGLAALLIPVSRRHRRLKPCRIRTDHARA